MGLISLASGNSTWKGLDYYQNNNVIRYEKINEVEYKGKVKGNSSTGYNVFINIEHPRKSKCDCPHAKDKKIICKHMVALYFTIFQGEADAFLKEAKEAQKEYEKYEEELYEKVIKYINSMTKKELQEALIEVLFDAPEWVYDRFVRHHVS